MRGIISLTIYVGAVLLTISCNDSPDVEVHTTSPLHPTVHEGNNADAKRWEQPVIDRVYSGRVLFYIPIHERVKVRVKTPSAIMTWTMPDRRYTRLEPSSRTEVYYGNDSGRYRYVLEPVQIIQADPGVRLLCLTEEEHKNIMDQFESGATDRNE